MTKPTDKKSITKSLKFEGVKYNDELHLAEGFITVSQKSGETSDYYDLDDDHVSNEEMIKAIVKMEKPLPVKFEHAGPNVGTFKFLWPVTSESKLQHESGTKGIYAGAYVPDDENWQYMKSGAFKGFSIGFNSVRTQVEA